MSSRGADNISPCQSLLNTNVHITLEFRRVDMEYNILLLKFIQLQWKKEWLTGVLRLNEQRLCKLEEQFQLLEIENLELEILILSLKRIHMYIINNQK